MFTILPTACLKVNQDTYYIPDQSGGIYFRNYKHSFRMQGSDVYQWMEKLIPMFDGTHLMQEITEGLPEMYQRRVYEFAAILLQEGFVRDVSCDQPHALGEKIRKEFQPQIDYLDHQIGSGAAHFEKFRQTSLLVIGSGPLLTSLLSNLLESGIQTIFVFITDKANTNMKCIKYLETKAKKVDSAIKVNDITPANIQPWSDIIQHYDSILFAGEETDVKQIKGLAALCEQENKYFLPAVTWKNIGMAGPAEDWESAWRRLEKTGDVTKEEINHTALAILANVLSFHWFQLINNVTSIKKKHFYLLDMQTLEGKWHTFLSYPLACKSEKDRLDSSMWFTGPKNQVTETDMQNMFARITSSETGIFRSWGPNDLSQLPLSQCQVELSDPLEEQKTLPVICSGLNHLEVRREAGFYGLEVYATRLSEGMNIFPTDEGKIGVGQNIAEAICRGCIKCLEANVESRPTHEKQIKHDEQSHYFVKCLTKLHAEPSLFIEQHSCGFSIGWVKIKDAWFSSIGLSPSIALQSALHKALHYIQNQPTNSQHCHLHSTYFTDTSFDSMKTALQSIVQLLGKNNKHLKVYSLQLEDILSQHLSVVGVKIGEGEN